jgi:small subunit ribosomal protein S23
MKLQTRAVNVLERTSHYLQAGVLTKKPVWFDVLAKYPPNKNFLHEPKATASEQTVSLRKDRIKSKNASPYKTRESQTPGKNPYKPNKLRFVEDELRALFYEQHPWELARPKILLENTGEDVNKQDWSSIRQLNAPLDGESVVQRTLYLIQNESKTLKDAYDQSRFEFYRVRIEQEIQEQVSREENEMFGSVYNAGPIAYGVHQEQNVIEKWKQEALEISQIAEASKNKNAEA